MPRGGRGKPKLSACMCRLLRGRVFCSSDSLCLDEKSCSEAGGEAGPPSFVQLGDCAAET